MCAAGTALDTFGLRPNVGYSGTLGASLPFVKMLNFSTYYKSFSESYLESYQKKSNSWLTVDQNHLYHYTNYFCAKNILNSGEIWLTKHKNLNDYTEVELAKYIFLDSAEKYIKNKDNYLFNFITDHYRNYSTPDIYIFSMTKSEDFLCQYRSYGNIAIGINRSNLNEKIIGFGEIIDVVYDQDEQFEIINDIVTEFYSFYSKHHTKPCEILLNELFYTIDLFAPIIKNHNFKYENESRLIIRNNGPYHQNLEIKNSTAIFKYLWDNPYFRITSDDSFHHMTSIFNDFYIAPFGLEFTKNKLKKRLKNKYRALNVLNSKIPFVNREKRQTSA